MDSTTGTNRLTTPWIYCTILDEHDEDVPVADLPAYLEVQGKAGAACNDPAGWARMAILNIARSGKCSNDRTVGEYAHDSWDLKSAEVTRAPRQELSTDEPLGETGVDFKLGCRTSAATSCTTAAQYGTGQVLCASHGHDHVWFAT
jgi:Carbohydrate phosphorylase